MSKAENVSLEDLRTEYTKGGLLKKDVSDNPIDQFNRWFAEAEAAAVLEPNAMVLATVDQSNRPSARTVLLKGADDRGFRFFTNLESRKAREIMSNPRVALAFHWRELERQVTINGTVSRTDDDESERYFRRRPYRSQIGALASKQSRIIENRNILDKKEAHLMKRYPTEKEVPFPEFWGGFVVCPLEIEFWQGREGRLHDRIVFRREGPAAKWETMRLSP